MQIIPVTTKKDEKTFLKVAVELYKNDPNWIQPLDKDILDVFDKEKNKAHRFGKTQRWILTDDQGKLIGRIAAYINSRYKNKDDEFPAGGFGFFECINNQEAADLLLDNAKHWLLQNGMEAMDGPINFGERDKFWGMLIEGFDPPLYGMNYNPPYYQHLLEAYGFKKFYDQICLGRDATEPLPEKILNRHRNIAIDPNFSSAHIEKSKLEKYAGDFSTIYNKAWAGHGGMKQLSKEQVLVLFRRMKPVMNEKLVWFAYYKNEPVAMFINLPDLNQWFKYLNGKFDLLHKIYFLWLKKFRKNDRFSGIAFGVVPEWQGKGVDAYVITEAGKVILSLPKPYTKYEMQWIGDFHPKMLNVAENTGNVERIRKLAVFRYIFDRTRPFKRHPFLS